MSKQRVEIELDDNEINDIVKRRITNELTRELKDSIKSELGLLKETAENSIESKINKQIDDLVEEKNIKKQIDSMFDKEFALCVKERAKKWYLAIEDEMQGIRSRYPKFNWQSLDRNDESFINGIVLASMVLNEKSFDLEEIKQCVLDKVADRVAKRIKLDKITYEILSQQIQKKDAVDESETSER